MNNLIIQYIHGNRHIIEIGKLITIALFALLSFFTTIYFLYFSPYAGFRFVYVFIPHLYLIPIILLALWYPKSGVKLVMVILASLFVFWVLANIFGYTFPPLFVILYTGIDLAAFVVFLLYVKDQRLVEAVILDLLERSTDIEDKNRNNVGNIKGDFDVIISALNSHDENIREEAISALSSLNDERTIFPLIRTLQDESPYIRRCAVEALGKTHSPKAIKPLIEKLGDDDRYVRESAAEVLGHLGNISMPEMIKHISNPDWRIRMGIAISFRLSPDLPDTDIIIRMLSDESVYVRREVVKTLGRIGDSRIMPYLIQATNDPDSGVKIRAIRAVKKIGTSKEIQQVLMRCMNDPDNAVRIFVKEG